MKTVVVLGAVLIVAIGPLSARAAVGTQSRRPLTIFCQPFTYLTCPGKRANAAPGNSLVPRSAFNMTNSDRSGVFLDAHFNENLSPSSNHYSFDAAGTAQSHSSNEAMGTPGLSTPTGRRIVEWTLIASPLAAYALSPLLDHRLHHVNSGIWERKRQLDFEYAVIMGELGGSLWFGGESRLGKTFWRSVDASVFTAATVQAMKYAFGRERPSQSASPNHWFKGPCCQSFPSGEVSFQASAVTPFIAEYHKHHPWVWALEALPAYDAVARMKAHGHWQTDVLAAWAIGTAWGLYAHDEHRPLFLSIMPHGIMVGLHYRF